MIEHYEKEFSKQQDDYDDCEMDLDGMENVVEKKPTKDNIIVSELPITDFF